MEGQGRSCDPHRNGNPRRDYFRESIAIPADYFQNWVGVQFWRERENERERGRHARESHRRATLAYFYL